MSIESIFPRRYFSKKVLPYWMIVILDCITIVLAGMLSIYFLIGGAEVVVNFWNHVCIWVYSLPIFLVMMTMFQTYGGIITKSLKANIIRLWIALIIGGALLQVLSMVLSEVVFPFRPPLRSTIFVVVVSGVLQCLYRYVARQVIKVDAKGNVNFFSPFQPEVKTMGEMVDTSVRSRSKINLCLAQMSEDGMEKKYVNEAFDMNWVVPLGPNVDAFEVDLEKFVNNVAGSKEMLDSRVAALSAGTAAVHLALLAVGVMPGDEVCVQSFTFCASANPIAYLGAFPIFIDSEPNTWNMDPVLLEQAIKDRIAKTGKKPKAIVPVALYGMPYQIDKIMEIANRYGIPVIEDAAEGFGSRFKGQVLGTFGRFGVLSFNGNKMITTSGGGALICNDEGRSAAIGTGGKGSGKEIPKNVSSVSAEDSRKNILWYATQARESFPYYQHEAIGYNYRLSNVCAGIGRGQMTVVEHHLRHHRHVQKMYEELLAYVPGVTVHKAPSNLEMGFDANQHQVYDSNYWLCTITLDPNLRIKGQENAYKEQVTGAVGGAAGVIHVSGETTTDCQPNDNVEALRKFMLDAQIEARPLWKPMHKQPVFKNAPAYLNGVSESLFKVGVCLPSGPWVSDDDVKYIVETIKSAIA
jgi:dTDP-4-amino-4,6-dideoxygalactose transaminase